MADAHEENAPAKRTQTAAVPAEPAEAMLPARSDVPALRDSGAVAESLRSPLLRQRREVLRITGLTRRFSGKTVLSGLDLSLFAGEAVLILGHAGSGKSTLARVLADTAVPEQGTVRRAGRAAPPIGMPAGLGATGTVERDLALRASVHGIDTGSYVAAVARLLDDPAVLKKRFTDVPRIDRLLLMFAASYLIPAPLYVADGWPTPTEKRLLMRLSPLFGARRQHAAVVWFSPTPQRIEELAPDRILLLLHGQLHELATAEEAIEAMKTT